MVFSIFNPLVGYNTKFYDAGPEFKNEVYPLINNSKLDNCEEVIDHSKVSRANFAQGILNLLMKEQNIDLLLHFMNLTLKLLDHLYINGVYDSYLRIRKKVSNY